MEEYLYLDERAQLDARAQMSLQPPSCCDHFLENGKRLDRVQKAHSNSPTFAALPEMLVLAWTKAALTEIGLLPTHDCD